jgi:hypothetical protein
MTMWREFVSHGGHASLFGDFLFPNLGIDAAA